MNRKINNIIYIFMFFQPLLDIITSLMTRFLHAPITLGIVVRGCIFLVSVIYILFLSKSKYKKASAIFLAVLGLFSFIYFATKPSIFSSTSFIFSELIYMFKYYYTIVIFLMMLNLFDDVKPNNRILFKLLQIELFMYCFSIFLANVTGTAFGTYKSGAGNTGWFYAGNEIGIISALLFPYLYLLINKSDSYKILLYVIPIVFGIEIIGTKTSMLGLLLPTIIFFIYYLIRIKGKFKQFVMTTIILLIIIVSSPNLPVVKNIEGSLYRFTHRAEHREEIDKDYSDKMLESVILSDRDYYQRKTVKIYNKATTTDKLFGLGFVNREEINNKNVEKLIEMDFYDVFYHYGLIGFIIYFVPLAYFIITSAYLVFKRKFRLNIKQILLAYVSYIAIVIGFMCGHVFGAPAVSFYMIISMVLLLYYLKYDYYQIGINHDKITILASNINEHETKVNDLISKVRNKYKVEVISIYKNNKTKLQDVKYLINGFPHYIEDNKQVVDTIKNKFYLLKMSLLKYFKITRFVEECDSEYIVFTDKSLEKVVNHNKNRDIMSVNIDNFSLEKLEK